MQAYVKGIPYVLVVDDYIPFKIKSSGKLKPVFEH